MKNKKIFILLVSISVLFLYMFNIKTDINFINKEKFILKDTFENNKNSFRAIYEYKNEYVKLEITKNTNQKESSALLNEKINNFQELFQNNISPYPGEVSTSSNCDAEFRPNKINENFYTAYLNERFQFGSCISDQLRYKGVIGYIYCPKNMNFYQIEYFLDKNNQDVNTRIRDFISSIKCP